MYQAGNTSNAELNAELHKVERAFNDPADFTYLRTLNVVPVKPRGGMIAKADGVNWNPGQGAGTYQYNGTAWTLLVSLNADGSLTLPKLTAVATTTDGTLAYADGTTWNPGGGEGLYIYYATAWNKL